MGEMADAVPARAYLGLGLWIPALARVTMWCCGCCGASRAVAGVSDGVAVTAAGEQVGASSGCCGAPRDDGNEPVWTVGGDPAAGGCVWRWVRTGPGTVQGRGSSSSMGAAVDVDVIGVQAGVASRNGKTFLTKVTCREV
jgi:hypothetical protein